jgi:hypothetical protein
MATALSVVAALKAQNGSGGLSPGTFKWFVLVVLGANH